MKVEKIVFELPIKKEYSDEISRRLFFATKDILDFKIMVEDDLIKGIEVSISKEADIEKIAEKVNYIIQTEVITQKILPPKVIWETSKADFYHKDAYDQLISRGMVYEVGEGQACFNAVMIKLTDALDAKIRDIALKMDGEEYRYPTLISTKTLEDCNYFTSFPHMLMFVTRLHNDVETYKNFLNHYDDNKGMDSFALDYCDNVDYCLPPTMCYHTYNQLRNTEFGENQNRVITSKGKSFRYESKYYHSLERLWDFTIREIIFMGNKEFVLDCREKFMAASFELMNSLGLHGYCEVANDPFFCNSNAAAKIFNQKVQELKYELRLNIDDHKTIAAGSFNFHDQFFGERFNIKKHNQEWISTGCVGFGLERLAYTFICQHGLDEKKWFEILGV